MLRQFPRCVMKYIVIFIFITSCGVFPECKGFSFSLSGNADQSLERAEHFFELNKYDSARRHYNLAAHQFKVAKVWKKYITAIAGAAHSLIKLRKYDDAKKILDSALLIGNRSVGKSTELATAHFVYGILLDLINEPNASLEMHQEALAMRKTLLGENHLQVAESYNGIGEVYRYILRDYVEAEKYFQRSIDILERDQAVNRKHLYRGYYNLATTNRLKNDFERALGFAFNAIQTLESIKPLDTTSLVRCYGIIANIYNNQNVYEKAITYYLKALSLQLVRKEMSSEMANDYTNLSQAYIETGKHSMALQCVDSALLILEKGGSYDSAGMANIYLIKGRALLEAKRNQEAILSYRRSLYIQKKYSKSNVVDISNLYQHLSETLYKSAQYDSALFYIQQCIHTAIGGKVKLTSWSNPPYEMLEHWPGLFEALAHKGAVLIKIAEKSNTINALKQAVDCFNLSGKLMDIYWDSQENENSKLHFASTNYYIYEHALNSFHQLYDLTSDEQYKALAFELMDKSKSRILRQGVEQARERARKYIPDSLLSQELNIKSRITSLSTQLSSTKDLDLERSLNMELLTRQKELLTWEDKIRNQFPQYTFESKDLPFVSLSQLQTNLKNELLFVEYFFGQEAIYAFSSFKGSQHYIKIESKDVKNSIYKFCSLLSKGLQSEDREADFREYTALGFDLYSQLLYPVVKAFDISGDEPQQILIVPDGALSLLPFQALLASKPTSNEHVNYKNLDYLVKHFTISYSFDATSPFASNHTDTQMKNLLAFGWSDGNEQNYTTEDLPGTYRELQAVSRIMPGEFRMGKEAIKKNFREEASDYNIIHLAIHGFGDNDDIYDSYLQFRDDKLFAHELYGYNLNASLTVLSACQSGYGKVFTAEGVYSIARGFFYAGSKSLLMTLWRINDGESVPLIQEFYKNVGQKEYASKALSKSQLDYLRHADEYSSHPRFWAGLVLWGSYKEVAGSDWITSRHIGIALLLTGMAGLGYFIFKKRKYLPRVPRARTS